MGQLLLEAWGAGSQGAPQSPASKASVRLCPSQASWGDPEVVARFSQELRSLGRASDGNNQRAD